VVSLTLSHISVNNALTIDYFSIAAINAIDNVNRRKGLVKMVNSND